MAQLFTNNAATTLSGTLTQGGTTMTLATGSGDKFPAPTGGDFFLMTIYEKDAYSVETRIEIVKVAARTADTLSIERDFENTVGVTGGYAYPSVDGATVYCELRWTAAGAAGMLQKDAVGAQISAATGKTTPVDADALPLSDSAASNVLKKLTWGNLKAAIYNIASGNLVFSGTGQRITGDISNATFNNRLAIQTNISNGATGLNIIPNGTSKAASIATADNSDLTNCAAMLMYTDGVRCFLNSAIYGAGTYLPIVIYTGGAERMRIDTAGLVGIGVTPTASVGTLQVNSTIHATSELRVGEVGSTNYSGRLQNLSNSARSMAVEADPANVGAGSVLLYKIDGAEKWRMDENGHLDSVNSANYAGYRQVRAYNAQATGAAGAYLVAQSDYGTVYMQQSNSATASGMAYIYATGATGLTVYAQNASAPLNLGTATHSTAIQVTAGTNAYVKMGRGVGETKTAPSISTNTLTLDCATSNLFAVSLNANITTLTISNIPASNVLYGFVLEFTADGTARTVTWPAAVKWAGGTAPTLTSTNAKKDAFAFYTYDGGTTWIASVIGQNF
jgi:hypothetical protein